MTPLWRVWRGDRTYKLVQAATADAALKRVKRSVKAEPVKTKEQQ